MSHPVIDFRVRLPEELRPQMEKPKELTAQYDAVLDISNKKDQTLSDLKAQMDEQGVDHAVIHAEFEIGDPADALNDAVAKVVSEEPTRFTGIGTFSTQPFDIMRAWEQMVVC